MSASQLAIANEIAYQLIDEQAAANANAIAKMLGGKEDKSVDDGKKE